MKEILISAIAGGLLSVVLGFLTAILTSKNAAKYGEKAGRWMSKFAGMKIGRKFWEAIEDKITTFFVELAKGIKTGADSDDDIVYEFEKKKKIKE